MNKTIAKILFKIPGLKNYARKQYELLPFNFRKYAAVNTGRLVSDWVTERGSINKEIKYAFKLLLDRARDLAKNNDYVRGYLKRCVTNIVGPEGFNFQSNVKLPDGELNEELNEEIEKAWSEWCKRENCTMQRNLSFIEVQKIWVNQWKRDGNILFRFITGKDVNKFGFALELLEIDLLDVDYFAQLDNGNAVLFGIEFNGWKQPVAYYFKSNKIEDELNSNYYYTSHGFVNRVPAEEIIHYYTREHSNQFLGITSLAQSMLTFHDLEGYDKAAIINARAGASKMGFLQTQANAMDTHYEGDDVDDDGNTISNFSFGEIEKLPQGLEFKGWDPTYPNGEYPNFVKQILRRMATGLGVAYANWIGDLEAVNFSSMRSGLLDERDNWKDDQSNFREGVLNPVYEKFIEYAIMAGAVSADYSDYATGILLDYYFYARRWDWVDPQKDVNAKILAIDNNIIPLTDVLVENGYTLNEYAKKRKKELMVLKELKQLENELKPEKKKAEMVVDEDDDDENEEEENNNKKILKVVNG